MLLELALLELLLALLLLVLALLELLLALLMLVLVLVLALLVLLKQLRGVFRGACKIERMLNRYRAPLRILRSLGVLGLSTAVPVAAQSSLRCRTEGILALRILGRQELYTSERYSSSVSHKSRGNPGSKSLQIALCHNYNNIRRVNTFLR